MIETVCIFCSSSDKIDDYFKSQAYELGKRLAISGKKIIYGGGNIGLMGKIADGSLSENGSVIGVIPDFLENLELGHKSINELHVVESMHQREAKMLIESDCIVALPGGIGTIEELSQAFAWKTLGIIIKPIFIVNLNNYFDPFIEMMEKTISLGFMSADVKKIWEVVSDIDELLNRINFYNE